LTNPVIFEAINWSNNPKKPHVNLTTKIVLGLILLHLLVGFGWLIYKLSPRKEEKDDDTEAGTPQDPDS
jgi:hypothetical protein